MYRYQLEKGSKKWTCPECGERRRFRRVLDTVTGDYMAEHVGVCDRVNSCGYKYTAKDYLRDNGSIDGPLDIKPVVSLPPKVVEYDYHDPVWLDRLSVVGGRWSAADRLRAFLCRLFGQGCVDAVFGMYIVGHFVNNYGKKFTMFPYISMDGKFARGKLIVFDPVTGKRSKERYCTSSLRHELGLKTDWNYDTRVFFGEHLIEDSHCRLCLHAKNEHFEPDTTPAYCCDGCNTSYSPSPIAIVESEKSALIGAITHPEYVWLATGTKSSLSVEKIKRLATHKTLETPSTPSTFVLFPDGDGFDAWSKVAAACVARGMNVTVSTVVQQNSTPDEQAAGIDIADLLIQKQRERLADAETERAEREAIQAEGVVA